MKTIQNEIVSCFVTTEYEPVCITNHTSKCTILTLELSCSVSFRGNWAPIMEWREEGSVNVITSDVINQTMANDSVSYSLTVPLNVRRESVRYTCTTRFIESMRPSSINATNVPNLTLVWTSPLVNLCKKIIFASKSESKFPTFVAHSCIQAQTCGIHAFGIINYIRLLYKITKFEINHNICNAYTFTQLIRDAWI